MDLRDWGKFRLRPHPLGGGSKGAENSPDYARTFASPAVNGAGSGSLVALVPCTKTRDGHMTNVQMDKAVILARGLGTRMRNRDTSVVLDDQQEAVAETGVKALIPIDRPFLDYGLSALADAGYRRVCLVVGPQHDTIRDYYGREVRPRRLTIEFAVQEEPRGTADAVLAAEEFADGDPFLMLNSDDYYPPQALRGLREGNGSATALFDWQSMLANSNIGEDRLRAFAVARFDDSGYLVEIIEKPDEKTLASLPRPLWMSLNCWRFGPSIFDASRAIKPSPRGELEITDAVQHAMDVLGERFRVVRVRAAVLDLTSRDDIAPIAAKLAAVKVDL